MSPELLKKIIEATLFAHGKPMTIEQLQKVFLEEEVPEKNLIREALDEIAAVWEGRGIVLREVASGFRFQAVEEVTPWVARLWEEKPPKYSRAVLETLALIAYRQPITRSEIEEIRGVSVSSHIIKSLQEREWIRTVGQKDVPGRPALYATTRQFLDYFDLRSLEELPALSEVRDLDAIAAELEKQQDLAVADAMNEHAETFLEEGDEQAEQPKGDNVDEAVKEFFQTNEETAEQQEDDREPSEFDHS